MKEHKGFIVSIICISTITLLLNILACSTAFCDAYTATIYSILSDIWGRFFGIFPFPVGEILMYLAAILLLATIIIALLLLILRKKKAYRAFAFAYLRCILITLFIVIFIYTTHWGIPYRSSLLGYGSARLHVQESPYADFGYSYDELRALRKYLVENLNECCRNVPRDEDGHVLYPETDIINQEIAVAMQSISDEFPRLSGYYPPLKAALCSDILDWMFIGGYTYPYTMEITYNQYASNLYYPSLAAHEAAHHQGYYQENEANFLSYLALSKSEDPVLRYSGYLYIYEYVHSDYITALVNMNADDTLFEECATDVLNQVWIDEVEAIDAVIEIYENDPHPLEDFSEVATDVSDVGWETQSEIIQDNGYDDVVRLMLEYYDGILY